MSSSAVELLEGLVSHYSPSGEEQEAVQYLTGEMGRLGYRAEVDEAGNAVGVRGKGPNEILLLGHIDTVPGKIEIRREGDLLHGRGTVDAKGPLACFTWAAASVKIPAKWRIRVVGAVGEEGDSRGARHLIHSLVRPAMVVIGEPSGWQALTLGYKGSLWLQYHLSQPLEHTAGRGASACEKAVKFWNGIQAMSLAYNAGQKANFEQITPTLRQMDSGCNGLQETANLRLGLRLPPGLEVAQAVNMVTHLAGDARIDLEDGVIAFKADKNTPLVRAFLSAIRKTGGCPSFTVKTGTSDMNIVGPYWQCPILAYGPGDSSLDHTPNEHIDLQEYQTAANVLRCALQLVLEG